MTSRSLYQFLLRMHPACFRKHYEDQMLWIFDESVRSRGAASLLFDAVVSLIRQWVLRSGYWRRRKREMSIDGSVAIAEQFHRNAEDLHRRAWRINLVWLISAFLVSMALPIIHWGPFLLPMFLNVIGTYVRSRQGRPVAANSLLSFFQDSRIYQRRQIEGKRDGLIAWSTFKLSRKTQSFGGGFLLFLLGVLGFWRLLMPLKPGTSFDWRMFGAFLCGFIALAVSWRFVKRFNKRAANAFQQEIDVLDSSAKPQSV